METLLTLWQSTYTIEFTLIVHVVLFIGAAFWLLRVERDPLSTLLWLFMVFTFPLVGFVLYCVLGVTRVPTLDPSWGRRRTLKDRRFDRQWILRRLSKLRGRYQVVNPPLTPNLLDFHQALNSISDLPPLLGNNDYTLYTSGREAIDAILSAIRGAKHTVFVMSYIISNDAAGRELMELLVAKARSGVKVYVLYDAIGSWHSRLTLFFRRYRGISNLKLAPFTHTRISKLTLLANVRNHRKITVVDFKIVFTGGVNFHAGYLLPQGRAIGDIHLAVRGPIVQELAAVFLRDWFYTTGEAVPEPAPKFTSQQPDPSMAKTLMRPIHSGPTEQDYDMANNVFNAALFAARKQILIATPYFIPTPEVSRALILAALRGVQVQIMVPEENNHPMIAAASRSHYSSLLKAGVAIYERHAPFVHTKALVIDGTLAIVGSSNLDPRSLNLNYETNLAIPDEQFADDLKAFLLSELAESTQIYYQAWHKRSLRSRIFQNMCNLLYPNL